MRAIELQLLSALLVLLGCSERHPLDSSSAWPPAVVGGDLIVQPLPHASKIAEVHQLWKQTNQRPAFLAYQLNLPRNLQKDDFVVTQMRSETPLGRPWVTFIKFSVKPEGKGTFQLNWTSNGRTSASEFTRAVEGRTVLLDLIEVNSNNIPRLEIVGIKGLEPPGVLIAVKGVKE